MAVLTTTQRDAVARSFNRTVCVAGEPTAFVRSVSRAAVDDTDNWAESAAASIPATSFNAALNTTFRNNATAAQKALLLALVCLARAGRPLPDGD